MAELQYEERERWRVSGVWILASGSAKSFDVRISMEIARDPR